MRRLYKFLIPVVSVAILVGLFNWGYIGHLLDLTGQAAMDLVTGGDQATGEFMAEIDSISATKILNPIWMKLFQIELPEDGTLPDLPGLPGDDSDEPGEPGDDSDEPGEPGDENLPAPGGEDSDDDSSHFDPDLLKLGLRALLLYLRESSGEGIIDSVFSRLLESLNIDPDFDLNPDDNPWDFELPEPGDDATDPGDDGDDDDDDYRSWRKGRTLLLPGTLVERYGKENDSYDYAFRLMTPFSQMSLPADYEQLPVYYFEVLKPVIVTVGEVKEKFGQEGGGTKYTFDDTITALIDAKILEETDIFPSEEETDASRVVLTAGTLIDCFEVAGGNTAFPLATPFLQRSEPRGYINHPYRVYRVVTDVEVTQTTVARAYGGDGGGTQYQFDQSLAELAANGTLESCWNSLTDDGYLVYDKPEYCNYVTEKGTPIYPNTKTRAPYDNGFAEPFHEETLEVGTMVDRYGYNSGSYVSPFGTSYSARALPVGTDATPYTVFIVKQPVTVQAGRIYRWFGEAGGGVQYKFSDSIQNLIKSGVLEVVVCYEP